MSKSTLFHAPVGVDMRITAITTSPLATRMQSMGIREGALVRVIARAAAGVRIVRVGDARISLAKALSRGITVDTPEAADVR